MDNIEHYEGNPKLVKKIEIKESIFGDRVVPTFKKLNELDIIDYEEYDDVNKVYIYCPHHADSDMNGIKTFTPLGATYKKRNKCLYIVASEDKRKYGRSKLILVSDNGNESKTFFAGNLISDEAWLNAKEGEEYIGYMNSKWIKKSVSDISKFCGKILEAEPEL